MHTIFLESGLIIETDLTKEEKAIIAAGEKEYEEHPENFTPLEDVIKVIYPNGEFDKYLNNEK